MDTTPEGASMVGRGPRNYLNIEPVKDDGSLQALRAEFARRLQMAMMERGWSQSDLARQAALHLPKGKRMGRDDISTYIRGNAIPRPDKLGAICAALGVDPAYLIPEGARRSTAADMRGPALPEFRWNTDGTVFVRVNQSLPSELALDIASKIDAYNKGKA